MPIDIEEAAKELESIAPHWARAIAVAKRIPECIEVDGQICRIADYDRCIVGEAWGWKAAYKYAGKCKICENFAESFYSYAWEDHISNGVIDSLKEFIKHYRNKHADLSSKNEKQERTIYLLNTTIIDPDQTPLLIRVDEITVDEAKELLKDGFVSAVGHEPTAQFLSMLLNIAVQTNRIAVKLKAGDKAVCLKLQGRLPEGKVLSLEEMQQIPYKLYLLTVMQYADFDDDSDDDFVDDSSASLIVTSASIA